MTETPEQTRVLTENLRDYTALRRSVADRKVAGVAGGLAHHLNVDPTLLRVLFVVLCFFGGAGFVLYGVAWLLVPEDGKAAGIIGARAGTRNTLLVVTGVLAAFLVVGDSWVGFNFPWPLAIVALVVAIVVLMNRDVPVTNEAHPPGDTLTAPPAGHSPVPYASQPPAGPQSPAPPWTPPVEQDYQPPAPRPDRGPKLFWVTLALIAVALGSLGLYEYAGGAVVEAAYPALALTVVGAMLVLGAWVGRPGGLILLGVLAAIALAVTSTIGPRFEGGAQRVDVSPVEAAEVKDTYYVPAGEIHVDLSAVDDIEGLDGRRIDLEANAGEIVVTVPDGMDVEVTADVTVGGEAFVLGQGESGPDVHLVNEITAGPGAPDLKIDARLLVGSIRVQSSEG